MKLGSISGMQRHLTGVIVKHSHYVPGRHVPSWEVFGDSSLRHWQHSVDRLYATKVCTSEYYSKILCKLWDTIKEMCWGKLNSSVMLLQNITLVYTNCSAYCSLWGCKFQPLCHSPYWHSNCCFSIWRNIYLDDGFLMTLNCSYLSLSHSVDMTDSYADLVSDGKVKKCIKV